MKSIEYRSFFIWILLVITLSCSQQGAETKKVIYINSYHRGHPSSDEIMDAVLQRFSSDSFNIRSYYMDTKRHPDIAYIQNITAQLFDSIQLYQPDILIVSDDNAVKYIVKPNIDQLAMPIVFCGVNGSDKAYHLPHEKVTGMLEVLPVFETVTALKKYYPQSINILVLTENTTTSRKEQVMLDTSLTRLGMTVDHVLVDEFEQWKDAFVEANNQYDMIYMVTHGAIAHWNHEEAIALLDEHLKVPVITCEDFMMPYAVFGLTKVASEQGIWAAEAARAILSGKRTTDFPVTTNKLFNTWINESNSEKIGFSPDTSDFVNLKILK